MIKTIPQHPFTPSGTANHKGVRDCGACPFGEDRTDVHPPLQELTAEQREFDARRTGEEYR